MDPSAAAHLYTSESRLFDYLEGRLAAAESRAVERHLPACPECRRLVDQLRELDRQLSRELPRPMLSTGFAARLWQRIEATPSDCAQAARAQTHRQIQAEMAAAWSQYRRRLFQAQVLRLLDVVGYSVAVVIAAYLLFQLIPDGMFSISWQTAATIAENLTLLIGMATAVVTTLALLGFLSKRWVVRWLAEL